MQEGRGVDCGTGLDAKPGGGGGGGGVCGCRPVFPLFFHHQRLYDIREQRRAARRDDASQRRAEAGRKRGRPRNGARSLMVAAVVRVVMVIVMVVVVVVVVVVAIPFPPSFFLSTVYSTFRFLLCTAVRTVQHSNSHNQRPAAGRDSANQ